MNMTLEQKIGQKLMVGWPSADPKEICENIKRYNFGNVVLFTRNISSPSQVYDACARIQEAAMEANGYPALISTDQEGGSVRRIYDGVTLVPGSMAIAAASDKYPDSAAQAGRITGTDLKRLGINMNLAPVADVNTNPHNPVIAIRAYGDDPQTVSRLASHFAAAQQKCGVMSCYKHFLGHGDVDVDSHLELPRLKKSAEEIELCELIPYKSGHLPDAIMSVHILYTALDDRFPASLSKNILVGILRKRLAYNGIIMTDCFEMDALLNTFSLEEASVFAANATTDIITVSHTFGRQLNVRNALIGAVKEGSIPMSEIDASVERILRAKAKYCTPTPEYKADAVEEKDKEIACKLSRAAVTIISGEPLPIDEDTVVIGVTNYVNSIVEDMNVERMDIAKLIGREFNIRHVSIDSKNFNMSEILAFAGNHKVVLCLSDSHLTLVQRALYSSLMQRGNKMILVSLRTPYDILNQGRPACHICTFEYTALSCSALIEVLKGGKAHGICPVRLDKDFAAQREDGNYLITNIIGYIKNYYATKLTLDKLSEEFLISPTYVCKLIKSKMNKSFIDFLNETRIAEAKRLLVTTNMKIYEIASLCGYTDVEYFVRVFKKFNGLSPKFFRNNYNLYDTEQGNCL